MGDPVEVRHASHSTYGGRRYEIVGGELKWGYDKGRRFEFARGQKYNVLYLNPAQTQHKGAVGVYIGSRYSKGHQRDDSYQVDSWCKAILECMGKRFQVDPAALVPWNGEITEEHLKLVSPPKRAHLMRDNLPACGCSRSPDIKGGTRALEEFFTIPENSRCKNCSSIAKGLVRERDE